MSVSLGPRAGRCAMDAGKSTKPRPDFANTIRVLRLCSVFEPPPSALAGKGVEFDPIGGCRTTPPS